MITINNFSIARLNNAEITGLFINIQKLMTDADRPNLGIDNADYLTFTQKLQLLQDQVFTTTTSVNTAAMQTADEKRSVIYKRIRLKLQVVECAEQGSSLSDLVELVRANFLSKYLGRVTSMAMQERTAIISGFILDLNAKLDEDAQELLGIAGDVTRLEQANNAFIAAYQARTTERAGQEQQKTQRLRSELTEILGNIEIIITFYANSTVEANATKAAACQAFIRLLNVLIGEAKTRYLQRTTKAENGTPGTPGASDSQNTPAGGNDTPGGGEETPGGNDNPAGGDDNPASSDDTPSGGNDTPGGTSTNPNGGVYHDGVTEF